MSLHRWWYVECLEFCIFSRKCVISVTAVCAKLSVSRTVFNRRCTSHNLGVKLDVIACKQRGDCAIDIARAVQTPKSVVHSVLNDAQATETKDLNLLKQSTWR